MVDKKKGIGGYMSFCRFSSDNWQCDLYCYEDVMGGITTHVASCRQIGEAPKVPSILKSTSEEWLKAHKKQMAWLDKAKSEEIGLPFDGESFNDPDYKSFLNRLLELRKVGYRFPDYVIDEVKELIKKEEKQC